MRNTGAKKTDAEQRVGLGLGLRLALGTGLGLELRLGLGFGIILHLYSAFYTSAIFRILHITRGFWHDTAIGYKYRVYSYSIGQSSRI